MLIASVKDTMGSKFAPSRMFAFFFISLLFCTNVISGDSSCNCESGVECEKSVTAADCSTGRVTTRPDCPCCFVCAKQLTESCNSADLPCDKDFGLICAEDSICTAEFPCTDDTSCGSDRFCITGACADPCRVLPDVCKRENLKRGVCVVRNHRAMCACPDGYTRDSSLNECVKASDAVTCTQDGQTLERGKSMFSEKCSKKCTCEESGQMSCTSVESVPSCPKGSIAMSEITSDMSELCKALIADDKLFDGCCVPELCQNATTATQEDNNPKGSRGFKLTDSQNNLDDDDDKPRPREMLIKEDEQPMSAEMPTDMPQSSSSPSTVEIAESKEEKSHSNSAAATTAVPTMQVTVLKRTNHSAVVKLPMNELRANLSIALSSQLQDNPASEDIWKVHQIPSGLTQLTLTDLQPNTSYTLKYSYGDVELPTLQFMTEDGSEDESLVMMTMTETATTGRPNEEDETEGMTTDASSGQEGSMQEVSSSSSSSDENSNEMGTEMKSANSSQCTFNGTTYKIGDVVMDGCEQRCECMISGEMRCLERCSIPFFKKGHFAHDPMCFEEPSGVDDCCVLAACARTSVNQGAGEPRVLKLNPCESAKCGPNSDCRFEVSPSGMQSEQENEETLCVCKEGFVGDPYNEKIGCSLGTTTTTVSPAEMDKSTSSTPEMKTEGCKFNNATYKYGEEHFDGCSYKCHCETTGEFLCRPRCSFQRDEEKEIAAGCEIQKDPSDSECCEMLVCHGEPVESPTKKEKPEIPADGCIYKNQTYAKDTKFYDGCEQQCMCFSNGDVTCQPRCPPAGPKVDDDCVTLPDPADKCCTVTVCDPQKKLAISDVMKAANETLENATLIPLLRPIPRSEEASSMEMMGSTEGRSSAESKEKPPSGAPASPKITRIMPINETSVMVTLSLPKEDLLADNMTVKIYYSTDMQTWSEMDARLQDLHVEGTDVHTIINGLMLGKMYYFRGKVNETETNVLAGQTRMSGSSEEGEISSHEVMSGEEHSGSMEMEGMVCVYKGRSFSYAEEFYDGCERYCSCAEHGIIKCLPIECPTDLGMELVDSNCARWEPATPKVPPNCCPEVRCVQNSSCTLGEFVFNNYEDIPQKISGCDKRCFCLNGNISCENLCPPMTEKPPADLPCPPELAMPVALPPAECCYAWVCRNEHHHNISVDGASEHLLNHTLTHPTNLTELLPNGTFIPYPPDDDQFVPPSTGNEPSFVGLNKVNREQLEDLLHQLSAIAGGVPPGGAQSGEIRPDVPQGTYVAVKDPQEVQELEKSGAKVIEQAEDGSFIVFIPNQSPQHHGPIALYPHPEILHGHAGPPGFPFGHFDGHSTDTLGNVMVRPLNESTLQIDFTVPPVLVGLNGVVEVLYTQEFATKTDPDQWERQVFQQAEDLIDNSHLQLFLAGLEPDSDYHIKIQVIMRDIQNAPASDILIVHTPPRALPTTTLPPEIVIDPELKLLDVTPTTVKISWRKMSDFEASLIDGVQLKYRAEQDQVYSTTPLIHRSITTYELTNLQSGQSYEVDLLMIPFPNQTTELRSEKPIHIKTLPEEDQYGFTIAVEVGKVTETTAELIVDGVPYPEDKYVHIYQVIYQSDLQKEQKSTFKAAKRESNKQTVLTDLKPGTRYRVWVAAFLTNGKKKRTNVIDVVTKAGQLPSADHAQQQKLEEDAARSQEPVPDSSSYYGALVALAIISTLSIIGIVVLLMILIRKQNQSKAPINDRKSESSYDNPSFKNYDIESNGLSKPGDP